jgi:hypothetical protein
LDLSSATAINLLQIRWRNGPMEIFHPSGVDRFFEITEGTGATPASPDEKEATAQKTTPRIVNTTTREFS